MWFITGAGRGLGRAFAEAALGAGDRVVAAVRDGGSLDDLTRKHPDTLRSVRLDVRDRREVATAVAAATDHFGRLDVIVNNAGFGLVGAIEEVSDTEVAEIVETNFLGALAVTQAVLPLLRSQRSGHIVQISTVGAVGTMPMFGMYNATKWALEGFSAALAAEVAPFGIRVTIAELGGFDTSWSTTSMRFASPNPAYDDVRTSLFGTSTVPWDVGSEVSTEPPPSVAAAALLAHVDAADGPLRLLIGDDAPVHVAAALDLRREDYERDPRFEWPGAS